MSLADVKPETEDSIRSRMIEIGRRARAAASAARQSDERGEERSARGRRGRFASQRQRHHGRQLRRSCRRSRGRPLIGHDRSLDA